MENQSDTDLEILPAYMEERYFDDPSGILFTEGTSTITWLYGDYLIRDIPYIEAENGPPYHALQLIRRVSDGQMVIYGNETPEWFILGDDFDKLEDGVEYEVYVYSQNAEGISFEEFNLNSISIPKIYNGISPIKEELGKGIGDCNLTNVKYYNKPKSISEIMFGENYLSPEYLATLPFPQYIEEFNSTDEVIESEYPLVSLKDGTNQQQLNSNMILWEQETISIDDLTDIYIPLFTFVPNGVSGIFQYNSEPVGPEDPFYGTNGFQPDGEPYPVYTPTGYATTFINDDSYGWFGSLTTLTNGKRYYLRLENFSDNFIAESERQVINWYAGATEDYIPPNQPDISITEEDTIYFGNIGRPDIQDYILRVVNNESLQDSEFTFPFTDNFPSNQWPSGSASVNNFADESLSDLINRKSTYVHPYNIFSTPSSIGYWKNIIPKDYSIFNREGLSTAPTLGSVSRFDRDGSFKTMESLYMDFPTHTVPLNNANELCLFFLKYFWNLGIDIIFDISSAVS